MNKEKSIIAEALNTGCACQTLDSNQLKSQLERDPLLKGIFEDILQTRPNLFSATSVFLSKNQLEQMTELINTIEKVIAIPEYQKIALNRAPAIGAIDHGPKGVFMGYDFHLSSAGPKLIEINTNAGGALLNLELAKAQQNCSEGQEYNLSKQTNELDKELYDMFLKEWNYQCYNKELKLIAIVDENPEQQYLYPEFQLFEQLFRSFKTKAVVLDPKDLKFRDHKLWYGNEVVDMVYNRLTDFYLEEVGNESIRKAYESGAVVLTPAPKHHALYANKINLVTLSNEQDLDSLKISPYMKAILLNGIPKTEKISDQNSVEIWKNRKNLFFKPASGFGGKATYRGDKITHKVWDNILNSEYVAQMCVPPSQRIVKIQDDHADLKVDIRLYVYEGKIQLVASRLYSGQTTNFRTTGGGFAPVFIV